MSGWIDFFLNGWGAPVNATLQGVVARTNGRAISGAITQQATVGVGWFARRIVFVVQKKVRSAARFAAKLLRSSGRAIEGALIGTAAMAGIAVRSLGINTSGTIGIAATFYGVKIRSCGRARTARFRKVFVVAGPKSNVRPFVVKDQPGVLPRGKGFRVA